MVVNHKNAYEDYSNMESDHTTKKGLSNVMCRHSMIKTIDRN